MRLILGIGNPGEHYQSNRHNVGFMFLDYFASKYSISFIPSRNDYYYAEHVKNQGEFCLIKPSRYVNNSGISANQAIHHYDASIDDLLVIHDDVHLPTGTFKVKLLGGDGGHRGVNSIIYHLFTDKFLRIRIGVGGKDLSQENLADYVLSDFGKEDGRLLEDVFEKCAMLLDAFIIGSKKQLLDANSLLPNSEGP